MSESAVIEALKLQGEQTHRQLGTLSEAVTEMANSVGALTTQLARVEERHAAQDDMVRRIGSESKDHENRIRELEKAVDPEQVADNDERIGDLESLRDRFFGSCKAGAYFAIVIAALITAASQLYPIITGP